MDINIRYSVFRGSIDNVKRLFDGYEWFYSVDIAFMFDEACNAGNINIVNLIIDKWIVDWSNGVTIASNKGYRDIVDLILKKCCGNVNFKCMDILMYNSFKFRWIDLIVKYLHKVDLRWRYMVHRNVFKYRYDILGWIWDIVEYRIVNVKVKLFDQNLF